MAESTVVDAVLNAEDEGAPVLYLPDGQRLVFPGCHAKHVSAADIETYEGRFEYWHGPTETLIVSDADLRIVSGDHELPGQYLAQLAQQLADECGAHFIAFGATGIWRLDAQGDYEGIMRPDRCLGHSDNRWLQKRTNRLPNPKTRDPVRAHHQSLKQRRLHRPRLPRTSAKVAVKIVDMLGEEVLVVE